LKGSSDWKNHNPCGRFTRYAAAATTKMETAVVDYKVEAAAAV